MGLLLKPRGKMASFDLATAASRAASSGYDGQHAMPMSAGAPLALPPDTGMNALRDTLCGGLQITTGCLRMNV